MRSVVVKNVLGGVFIVFSLTLLGVFSVYVNHLFYLKHGPFFDSLSYDGMLAQVMLSVRADGILKGLSFIPQSTVALPWIEASFLAPFFEPSRAIGVWIQISWMMVTALAGYVYFLRVQRYNAVISACCALMFFFIASTFGWNGGASDFRMDYFQYILFGLACYLYLIALVDGRFWIWALWGLATGLACLARATTPVYVVLVFGPFFLIDLWRERTALKAVILRYAVSFISCFAVCGWFYISNLPYLYYYYFIWNSDANAKLPWSVSRQHAGFVLDHIGPAALAAGIAIFVLNVVSWILRREPARWNLRALWCGVAPLGFLIASGAGLNPFVSETAAFGFVLFAVAPITLLTQPTSMRARTIASVIALVLIAAYGVNFAIRNHTDVTGQYVSDWVPQRRALTKVSRCITDDVARHSTGALSFATLYTGSLNTDVIMNSLVFDEHRPAKMQPNGSLVVSVGSATLAIAQYRVDNIVTPVEWSAVSAASDMEKVDLLARKLSEQADYFIIPSPDSALPQYVTINKYAGEIGDKVAEIVSLHPLCQYVQAGPGEFVDVYRKVPGEDPAGSGTQWRRHRPLQASVADLPTPPSPPPAVPSFPAGLIAPGLFFSGVSQDGWLKDKARAHLALPGESDQLHIAGDIPDFSPKISSGVMKVLVDGTPVLERPQTSGSFDLVVPIPKALGPRWIDLQMTGADYLPPPDGRLVSIHLASIALGRSTADESETSDDPPD